MWVVAQMSVARLLTQEKHQCGYWQNGGHRDLCGKVLTLAMGIPVVEPLLTMNMSVSATFFQA